MIRKDKNIIERSRVLREGKKGKGPVVYWMERDFRIQDNWALLYAHQEAVLGERPLIILMAIAPEDLKRPSLQTLFLLHSLQPLIQEAEALNIGFTLLLGQGAEVVSRHCRSMECAVLVTDFSPLKRKREQSQRICDGEKFQYVEVDSHNIVPAWLASEKKEYGAYTLRPKLQRLLPQFLTDFPELTPLHRAPQKLPTCKIASEVIQAQPPFHHGLFSPGGSAGHRRMHQFIRHGLDDYAKLRNDPTEDGQSNLSPYLHFGLLSAQRLALEISRAGCVEESKKAYLEELIVRKELADNFCMYERHYDGFSGFPAWAQKSLNEHRSDFREFQYSREDFENCATHEPLWNSCQRNLMRENKLHGYLRMYWAKKILEWSTCPEEAQQIAIYLNDRYSLDGCDPNGYAGIAWSIGGVHDRAWAERKVFGKVRYMNERGCRRKFAVEKYIEENS